MVDVLVVPQGVKDFNLLLQQYRERFEVEGEMLILQDFSTNRKSVCNIHKETGTGATRGAFE